MKQTQATRRLGEQLREKLGYILLFEVSDPRLDLVTLTAVEVAVDRSFARVYVSCDASRYDEVMEALASDGVRRPMWGNSSPPGKRNLRDHTSQGIDAHARA